MFSNPYFHNLYAKYIAGFGALFNNIYIRQDENLTRVPFSYAPREKFLTPTVVDPDHEQNFSVQLPRMSYIVTGMQYAANRKMNSMNKIVVKDTDNGSHRRQYAGVPYDISFSLYVIVKNREDGHRIIEQILPNFTPNFVLSMSLIPEMGIEALQIPVSMNSIATLDEWDGQFDKRQITMWQLDFTLEAWFFGPVRAAKIIKFANTQFFPIVTDRPRDSIGAVPAFERVTVRPGLTANGEPTTVLADSVPLADIDASDDWGLIVTVEDVP